MEQSNTKPNYPNEHTDGDLDAELAPKVAFGRFLDPLGIATELLPPAEDFALPEGEHEQTQPTPDRKDQLV